MTLTKGLGINPTLFLHFTFPLQIAGFLWRARQDSNLRPSLFVVIGSAVLWTLVGPLPPPFAGFCSGSYVIRPLRTPVDLHP